MVGQLEPQHTHGTRSARATAHAALTVSTIGVLAAADVVGQSNQNPKSNKEKKSSIQALQMQGMGKEEKAAGDEAMGAQLQRRIIEVLRKRKAGATC